MDKLIFSLAIIFVIALFILICNMNKVSKMLDEEQKNNKLENIEENIWS